MKKAASIFLRSDITEYDALKLAEWLENENVAHFLNERAGTAADIRRLVQNVPEFMLSCMFNKDGRFFMIYTDDVSSSSAAERYYYHNRMHSAHGVPIGFIRLDEVDAGHFEIVFAVGEQDLWGKGYGSRAVSHGLAAAFLEERADKVTARIYKDNLRSVKTVVRCGFAFYESGVSTDSYTITREKYLSLVSEKKIV